MKKNTLSYLIILPIIGLIGFGVQDLILVSVFNFFLSKYSYFFLDNLLIEISLFIFVFACLVSLAMRHYGKRHLEFILVFTAVLFIWSYRFYSFYAMDTSKITSLLIFGSLFLLYIFKYWIDYSHNKTSTEVILEDNLGRKEFVKKLVDHLAKIKNQEAFNVALLGEWGSGKSYLLRYVKEELEGKDNIIVVEFAPWSFENIQSIEIELLKAVKNNSTGALEEYFSELIHLLNADNESSIFKTISFGILRTFKKTEKEIHTSIKQELKEKKLFILLDDLDRLENREMESVMRVIRNTLNYPNVHFIVGFDDIHVLNSLGIEKNESKYLDKFFQIRIHVPVVKDIQGYFKDKFQKEVKILLLSDNVNESYKLFWRIVGDFFLKKVDNLRTADNIISNYKFIYSILKHDTDSFTLLQLEIIRNLHPEVYIELSNNYSLLEGHVKSGLSNVPLSSTIANHLKISSISGKFKITEPLYFSNYFRYIPDDNQISQREIFNILSDCNKEALFELIMGGYGFDIFNKIDIVISQERVTLSEEILELIVDAYEKYTGSKGLIYRPLINHALRNKIIGDYFVKSGPEKIIYKIEYFNLDRKFDLMEIAVLLRKYTDGFEVYSDKALSSILNEIYFIMGRNDLIGTPSGAAINQELDNILIDVFEKKPISFLENMIISLTKDNSGRDTFTIMNNFIPKTVSYEDAYKILKQNSDIIKAMEFIQFLEEKQKLETKMQTNHEYVDFVFNHNNP